MGAPVIRDHSRPRKSRSHTIGELIADMGNGPLLTAEEERELGRTIRSPDATRDRKEAAIRELMDRNVRLVLEIARRSSRPGEDIGDLVSDGTIGLRRAAELFDPRLNRRFSTYASCWIKEAIRQGRFRSGAGHLFIFPVYIHSLRVKASKLRDRIVSEGGAITLEEAARATTISGRTHRAEYLRLFDVVAIGGDAVYDAPSRGSDRPAQHVVDSDRLEDVLRFAGRLGDRERSVLFWYYGLEPMPDGERPTHRAIGDRLGVTKERVRQIIGESLSNLRRMAKEAGCS